MNAFDLLFLLLVLVSAIAFVAALWFAASGQRRRAMTILRRWLIGAAGYFTLVILVSLFLPRRELRPGKADCFDDWCISIDEVHRTPGAGSVQYDVRTRIFSRARRVEQRERNLALYVTDREGNRFNPIPAPDATPFDVLLAPSEAVVAARRFEVPATAQDLKLVIAHEGGFPITWFIVGYESWFRKPTFLRLAPTV